MIMSKNVYPKVNWRKDHLYKYESYESFVAKFCILNVLTVKQFQKIWNRKFQTNQDRVKFIENVLKESPEIIKTVFLMPQDTLSKNIIINKRLGLKYCNKCLIMGYHSLFHDKVWLEICPIHKCLLLQEKILPNTTYPTITLFEKRVITLIKFYRKNSLKNNKEINLKSIEELSDWLENISYSYEKYIEISHLDNMVVKYTLNSKEKLFSFCHFILPPNDNLLDLFPYDIGAMKTVYTLSEMASYELKKLINTIPLQHFLIFYQFYCESNSENLSKEFTNYIKESIVKILNLHKESICLWSDKAYVGKWEYFEVDFYFHNNLYKVCIFEYLLQKINMDWLSMNKNNKKDLDKLHSIYYKCKKLLIENNMMTIFNENDFLQKINLNFSTELLSFFDFILYELAKNYIADIYRFLKEEVYAHRVTSRYFSTTYKFNSMNRIYLKYEGNKYVLINSHSAEEELNGLGKEHTILKD